MGREITNSLNLRERILKPPLFLTLEWKKLGHSKRFNPPRKASLTLPRANKKNNLNQSSWKTPSCEILFLTLQSKPNGNVPNQYSKSGANFEEVKNWPPQTGKDREYLSIFCSKVFILPLLQTQACGKTVVNYFNVWIFFFKSFR